ncbi:GNVR domain-containing protein [Vibrio caribbeanicus]|uniref:GNVR domain-containing protein n=1 Tax=Vibrio caribbeanicus TaxID=701175 RepID=UPI0030DCABCE
MEELIKLTDNKAATDVLSEKYAKQLFKIALLKSPEVELINVLQQPVKPTTHIKPKRFLFVTLGVILGDMLGASIVLVRFALRKENYKSELIT